MSWSIGIDFGLRQWGLARGIHGVVEPIGVIAAVGGIPDWDSLHQQVRPWARQHWVIGIAVDRDGGLLLPARVLHRHWRMIRRHLGGEVVCVDETLSTQEARECLWRQGRPLHKAEVDALSACIILERYYALYGVRD